MSKEQRLVTLWSRHGTKVECDEALAKKLVESGGYSRREPRKPAA